MKNNRLIGSNAATVFIFGYGLIVQIVAFAIIYVFISNFPIKAVVVEALVFLWYCVPAVSVFSIVLAFIQIKKRINSHEKFRAPLTGLVLNLIWLFSYLYVIYLAYVGKVPFLITN